jgi:hypothetical protein
MANSTKLRVSANKRFLEYEDGAYFDGLGYGILREEWVRFCPQGFSKILQDNQ